MTTELNPSAPLDAAVKLATDTAVGASVGAATQVDTLRANAATEPSVQSLNAAPEMLVEATHLAPTEISTHASIDTQPLQDTFEPAPVVPLALPEPMGLAAVGQILRETRLQKGMSVVEASAHLKRAQRQIEALETGRESDLPPLAFVKGFVRNYAKLLGLDGEVLVGKLNPVVVEENVLAPGKVDMRELFPQHDLLKVSVARTRKSWAWLLLPVAITLLLLAVLEWVPGLAQGLGLGKVFPIGDKIAAQFSADNVRTAPPSKEELAVKPAETPASATENNNAAAPSSALTPAATIASSPAVADSVSKENTKEIPKEIPKETVKDNSQILTIKFSEVSWVDIKDSKGQVLLAGVQAKASEQNLGAIATERLPLSLAIGNAAGTQIVFRGKPVDLSAAAKDNVAKLNLP